jgi:hypothetical protein
LIAAAQRGLRHIPAFALALACVSSSVSAFTSPDPANILPERQARPAGEGVICLWGITNAAAEIGRRCRPGQSSAFQAELERSVGRVDAYVLRNSPATAEDIARFKREQGLSETPQAQLCTGELIAFYDHLAARGPEALRSEVDRLLSRPGPPTWGDCL